jgi:transcriptional regulator with XRE-family HTH domain
MKRRLPTSVLGDQLRLQFAANVRTLRKGKGMTQLQLATAAGLGRVFINQVERGHNSVNLETIGAIASALGERPATLIGSSAATRPQPAEGPPMLHSENSRRLAGKRG